MPFSISSGMNIARGLESQADATLDTQYDHLLDCILHLYFLLERNWKNVLSIFFCDALDYMLFLKMGFFVFCFLTIYSWLWTSFISDRPLSLLQYSTPAGCCASSSTSSLCSCSLRSYLFDGFWQL